MNVDSSKPHRKDQMSRPAPRLVISGASMDAAVPKNSRRKALWVIAAAATAGIVIAIGWRLMPRGLSVQFDDVRTASANAGVFQDNLVVRANAASLRSVILDAIESGRVEEVAVRDGAMVEQGQLLFRLSNDQRRLELLARESDYATQISNLSNLRFAYEGSRSEHQRRSSELQFDFEQAEKEYLRHAQLAEQGLIARTTMEESRDKLQRRKRALQEENTAATSELSIKLNAIRQLDVALGKLKSGLDLVNNSVDALVVRAPVAGRLTDFNLQVGETVKADQYIGRVDDPEHFKLSAQVDEYYLSRVANGLPGKARVAAQDYTVKVERIFPQIKDGRFSMDLVFDASQPPNLNPGQGVDLEITLGDPVEALLLPMGAFINDTGGNWVYVVDAQGLAQRRPIRTGRRSASQVEVLGGLSTGETVIVSSYATFGEAPRLQLTH